MRKVGRVNYDEMSQEKEPKLLSKYFASFLDKVNDKESYDGEIEPDYDVWAEDYESDEKVLGYSIHVSFAQFLEKILSDDTGFTKSASVLDLTAGTGWLGEELRKKGFDGQIDANDASAKMLEVADRKKGVYNRIFCHKLTAESAMPKEMSSESYDIAAVCGGIHFGGVTAECIPQFLSCVHVGGLIVITLRKPSTMPRFEFHCLVERECFKLENQGYWQLVDEKLCLNYRKSFRTSEIKHVPAMQIRCYKKL